MKTKKELLIKRIVGLPGEEVSMVQGVVLIDGVPLRESCVIENMIGFGVGRRIGV